MSSRDAWTLFRVGGVPVRIHFTWLFVAAYLTLLFTGQFWRLARAADIADVNVLLPPWAWGVLLTLLLFACVLLHELAHVAVARRGGARVRSVTLMMLGGISEIADVERPELERRMSLAGPALSLLLALLFYGVFRASLHGSAPDLQFGLFYLAQVNLIIGFFNLLPAFPMDGGRVLRSLLVGRFGRLRATQIAATVGKVIAVGLAIVGILGGGWWIVLIALFIFLGGEAEYRAVQTLAALRGLRVADLYSREAPVVDAGATAAQAAGAMLASRSDLCFVVAGERPIGVVTAAAIAAVPVRTRASVPVANLMHEPAAVRLDDDLPSVLKLLAERRLPAAAVVDGDRWVGALSREDIARGLQLRDLAPAGAAPATD